MNCRARTLFRCMAIFAAFSLSLITQAQTTPFAKGQVPTASAKWKMALTNFASTSTIAEKTLRTGGNRRRAAERLHADSVQIQRTQKLGETKPSNQKTI